MNPMNPINPINPSKPTDNPPAPPLRFGEGAEERGGRGSFDPAAALDRVDDDRELLIEILGLFREQAAASPALIESALAHQDGSALERTAHSLKGAAGNISADEVHEAAQRLEHAGRGGDWDAARTAWADLAAALPRLDAALTEFEES